MHYIGGKQKSGGHKIAAHVLEWALAYGTTEITEPFCGGLSVTYRLAASGKFNVDASDACEPLIEMYRAIQRGWDPPSEVSRETWEAYKVNPDPHDPMTAFCGFGCSRSGAWFSSFAAYTKRNTNYHFPAALAARESLLKKLGKCQRVKFEAGDYMSAPVRGVWYCDKPYEGSVDYPAVKPFDHKRFWREIAIVSESIPVLISERSQAPEGFRVVDEWSVQSRIHVTAGEAGRRTERLYVHERWGQPL
jgi:hypothetical protein